MGNFSEEIVMKNFVGFLSSVVLLIGVASCNSDEIIVEEPNESGSSIALTFRASDAESNSNASTRTLVREGFRTYWTANDRISLFAGDKNYSFITKDGGLVADFRGTVEQTAEWYCALYPYNRNATFDYDGFVFQTVLYAEQYAEPDSYASGMNLAVARSTSDDAQDLAFYNSASYLHVNISENYTGDDIYSMKLTGNNNENLAGDVEIVVMYPEETGAKVIENENAKKAIYLNQINEDDICYPGKSYYFVLPPTNMSQGYTLTLFNKQGGTCSIPGEPTDFLRNKVYDVTIGDVTFDEPSCGYDENGVFLVSSAACLKEWAELAVDDPTLSCRFTADIDFSEIDTDDWDWPQIGSEETPFTGKIIGNSKTISDFNIQGDGRFSGFIAVLGEEGSVESLNFNNPSVSSSYTGSSAVTNDDGFVGVVVGKLNVEDEFNYTTGSITNCHVTNPTIEGGENVGGIVGRTYGRNDAVNGCTVTGGTIQGHMFVGGIAGNSEGILEDCHVKGGTQISYVASQAEARVGGIVGTNNSGQVVACTANAVVDGDVNALDARYCGGIAGANNGTIIGCVSSGQVLSAYGGALAGESYGDIYGSYANQIEAAALIYKIKKSMNDPADVTLPTFEDCYWKTSLANVVVGSGEESGTVTDCAIVSDLSKVLGAMNDALDNLRGNTDYAYGAYYEYERNAGDDKESIPYKAVKP